MVKDLTCWVIITGFLVRQNYLILSGFKLSLQPHPQYFNNLFAYSVHGQYNVIKPISGWWKYHFDVSTSKALLVAFVMLQLRNANLINCK